MAKTAKCKSTTIKFKTKRGKVISFKGHAGSGCAPRKKPSTRHLKVYQEVFGEAAKKCAKKYGGFTKAAGKCAGDAVKAIARSNRRR